mmetsp:Transcript_335/g.843  ORF Transcript_335/g.843 Transcript_335/m.843 type:complete len:348 (-) Transcript_335:780-1823(-)
MRQMTLAQLYWSHHASAGRRGGLRRRWLVLRRVVAAILCSAVAILLGAARLAPVVCEVGFRLERGEALIELLLALEEPLEHDLHFVADRAGWALPHWLERMWRVRVDCDVKRLGATTGRRRGHEGDDDVRLAAVRLERLLDHHAVRRDDLRLIEPLAWVAWVQLAERPRALVQDKTDRWERLLLDAGLVARVLAHGDRLEVEEDARLLGEYELELRVAPERLRARRATRRLTLPCRLQRGRAPVRRRAHGLHREVRHAVVLAVIRDQAELERGLTPGVGGVRHEKVRHSGGLEGDVLHHLAHEARLRRRHHHVGRLDDEAPPPPVRGARVALVYAEPDGCLEPGLVA